MAPPPPPPPRRACLHMIPYSFAAFPRAINDPCVWSGPRDAIRRTPNFLSCSTPTRVPGLRNGDHTVPTCPPVNESAPTHFGYPPTPIAFSGRPVSNRLFHL